MRHHLRPDHPRALAATKQVHLLVVDRKAGIRDLQLGIGRQDRGRKRLSTLKPGTQRGFGCGDRVDQLVDGQRNADDARRAREDLIEDDAKVLRHGNARFSARFKPRLAGRAVRVACIHQNGRDLIAGSRKMSAPDCNRRGNDLVGCIHHRGRRSTVADRQRDVGFAARFDARRRGGPAEAEGKCDIAHTDKSIKCCGVYSCDNSGFAPEKRCALTSGRFDT
jgi:hypothetical protein